MLSSILCSLIKSSKNKTTWKIQTKDERSYASDEAVILPNILNFISSVRDFQKSISWRNFTFYVVSGTSASSWVRATTTTTKRVSRPTMASPSHSATRYYSCHLTTTCFVSFFNPFPVTIMLQPWFSERVRRYWSWSQPHRCWRRGSFCHRRVQGFCQVIFPPCYWWLV